MTKSSPSKTSRERGVVLLFCLIVLVVLLSGGVAVVRSMNSSLFSAGNLAFKRDLVNRGELAASTVLTQFKSGALATVADTYGNIPAKNYSAVQLVANDRGIPVVLLKSSSTPTGKNVAGGDFSPTGADITDADAGVSIRYVIDRLCSATGEPTITTTNTPPASGAADVHCVSVPSNTDLIGGDARRAGKDLGNALALVYRLTVRVSGPRDTQVFLQSSFTNPLE